MVRLIFVFLVFVITAKAQTDAESLWSLICSKAGVSKKLHFVEDKKQPVGGYTIKADTVFHNSDNNNQGAVYAVSRIAEELYDAVMIRPEPDGIILQKKSGWKDLYITYVPKYVRLNFTNNRPDPNTRLWLWWHHIPTYPTSDGRFWHVSWFRGLALKYPEIAPHEGQITESTKCDITHPRLPEIIYKEWQARGSPNYCSLFELDGTRFWWLLRLNPAPVYLNDGEKDRYYTALLSNIHPSFTSGQRFTLNGIRYTLTDNLAWALAIYPKNNKYARAERSRYNLTSYYLRFYKAVQAYFDSQGANHVRFNILAYSAYRCLPDHEQVDLTRFDVYYTSPTARSWTNEEMLQDAAEAKKWKRTGANLIWRPNHLFKPENRLIYPLISEYLKNVEFDGFQLAPYYRPVWPLGSGIDYYATFCTLLGRDYVDYFKYVPYSYFDYHKKMLQGQNENSVDEEDDL
jgi:hypothetical protein